METEATAKSSAQSGMFRLSHFSTVDISEAKFISGDGLEAAQIITCAGT